jgi:hypothetical protein
MPDANHVARAVQLDGNKDNHMYARAKPGWRTTSNAALSLL